jgi:hypothetical protein
MCVGALLVALVSASAAAPKAEAHYANWWWTGAEAEARIGYHYQPEFQPDCVGYGRSSRSHGRRYYRHFMCAYSLEGYDPETVDIYSVELHVTGQRGCRFLNEEFVETY